MAIPFRQVSQFAPSGLSARILPHALQRRLGFVREDSKDVMARDIQVKRTNQAEIRENAFHAMLRGRAGSARTGSFFEDNTLRERRSLSYRVPNDGQQNTQIYISSHSTNINLNLRCKECDIA